MMNNCKKQFTEPQVEIIKFKFEDILSAYMSLEWEFFDDIEE